MEWLRNPHFRMSHGKNNDNFFFELAGSYGAVGNELGSNFQ